MAMNGLAQGYLNWDQANQIKAQRDAQLKEAQQLQQMNAMKLWDMQNQQNAQRAPLNQMISDWMAQQPPQSPAGAPPQPPVALSAGPQPPMPVSNGPMIGGMQPASLPSNAQLPPPRPQGVPPYQTVNSMAPPPGQPSTPMPPDRGMPVAEMPPQQAIAQPFNMNMAPPGQSPQPQGQQQQPPSPMQMIQMLAKSGQPPEVQDALFNRMVPIWEITHKQDLEQLKAMLIPAQIQNTLALAGLHNVNAGAVPTKLNQSAKKETDLDTHRKAQEEYWKGLVKNGAIKAAKAATGASRSTMFERLLADPNIPEARKEELRREKVSSMAGETTTHAKEKPFIEMKNNIGTIRTLLATNNPESHKQVQAMLASLVSHQRSTNLLYSENAAFGNLVDRLGEFASRAITGKQYDERTRNEIRTMLDNLEKYSANPGIAGAHGQSTGTSGGIPKGWTVKEH